MLFLPPMPELLTRLSRRLVVVGSVARTIRNPDFKLPKDLDLLCDLDSQVGRKEIQATVSYLKMTFESPFIGCWTFRDYGWMVEILGVHHGPFYRTVRRRAEQLDIDGIKLWVAQPADAPKERETARAV
jgi:hypothetical protein